MSRLLAAADTGLSWTLAGAAVGAGTVLALARLLFTAYRWAR